MTAPPIEVSDATNRETLRDAGFLPTAPGTPCYFVVLPDGEVLSSDPLGPDGDPSKRAAFDSLEGAYKWIDERVDLLGRLGYSDCRDDFKVARSMIYAAETPMKVVS